MKQMHMVRAVRALLLGRQYRDREAAVAFLAEYAIAAGIDQPETRQGEGDAQQERPNKERDKV